MLAYGATICTVHVEMNRNQLDNILPALKPSIVLCEDGLGLDDILTAASAPCLPLGSWDDGRGDSFFAAVNRCEPSDASADAQRRRQRGDPVHLRHQRAAEGRGAELSRASVQRRPDRRRLRPDRAGSHLRFPLVQLVLGADLERAAAALARRDADPRPQVLAQPVLRSHPAARRDDRDRQSDHHRHPAQRRRGAAAPELPTLRFMTSSSAPLIGRRMAAVRGALRHSRRAGLRLQRDRLDRRAAGRAAPHRHGRPAARLSPAVDRRRRRAGAAGGRDRRGRARRPCRTTPTATLADDGSIRVDESRPHEDRRPRLPRRRGLSAPDRPRQGPDHPRRRQHLAGGDRRAC